MKPQKEMKGIVFFPVPEFSGVEAAFGADKARFFCRRDLPEVPRKYEDMANQLFFKGGELPVLHPNVDRKMAMTALRAWLGSFAPAHEEKVATAGYALWLWTHQDALSA